MSIEPRTNPVIQERICFWLRHVEEGRPVTMAVCVRRADGTVYPLGDEDHAKLAAARLVGLEQAPVYLIEEQGTTPDRLESLRKELEKLQAEGK